MPFQLNVIMRLLVLFLFLSSCNSSLKHFSKEPIERGVIDTVAFQPEVIVEGVKFLFLKYEFQTLKSDTLHGSDLILIGEYLSTRLNESNETYPTGSVRIILEPLKNNANTIIRVRWYAPLRKGYEEKKKRQEELYQKNFLNELVFHVNHSTPAKSTIKN